MIPRLALSVLLALPIVVGSSLTASTPLTNGHLQLHFLNVGQGDAALIVTPLGQVVAVDNGVVNQCERPVSYLRALGVNSLEYHVASHYHADHIGCTGEALGTAPLVLAGFDRGGSYASQTFQRYTAALGSKRQTAPVGNSVMLDSGVSLDFVAANGGGVAGADDENDLSVVLRVRFGEFQAVLAGDLSGVSEAGYRDIETSVAPLVGPVEVYKVNHHASRYSSNAKWLQTIQPKVGIVSVGSPNPYGHPSAEAMARLHAANVSTFWTSAGSGAAPVAGLDTVAGNVVVDVAPNATAFEVRYGAQTRTFPLWAAPAAAPAPPLALTAAVAGTNVNLAWLPPMSSGTSPNSYVVEAAFTPAGPAIATLYTSGTSLQVAAVPDGTYFVRTRAVNVSGTSDPSNEIIVTVGGASGCAAPPSAPTSLDGVVSASLVGLRWNVGGGGCAPTGYVVRAGALPGQTNLATLPVGPSPSALQVNAPPGAYYVTVVAQNGFGTSAPSNEIQVTVGPSCTLPGAPVGLAGGAAGPTTTFTWAAPATGGAPTDYLLEAGSTTGSANLAVVPVLSNAFSTSTPVAGTYFVRVRGRNACGTGPASSEQTLVISTVCSVPGRPSTPTAIPAGTTASVSWAPVSGAATYRLDVGTVSGGFNVLSESATTTTRQLAALSPGTYFARVTATNACGPGPVSAETQFVITAACTAPFAPTTPTATVAGSTATLSWSAVSGASSYRVEIGTAAGAANVTAQTGTTTAFQQTGLPAGTYFARVYAVTACGSSTVSGERIFTVTSTTPPTGLTCSGVSIPTSVACGTPTARCNDGTFSCSQNRSGTCSSHGGVSCWVCPGPLCG